MFREIFYHVQSTTEQAPRQTTDASSLDRLTAWKVTVNGVASPKSFVTLKDGQIVVRTPHGLLFIIR